jgi:hypothetical protein
MAFTIKHTSPEQNTIKVIANNLQVYGYDYFYNNLYKASTGTSEISYIFPRGGNGEDEAGHWNICSLIDINGEIWYWDGLTSRLKAIDQNGNVIRNIDSNIIPVNGKTSIVHLGDCLLVNMVSDYWETPYNPNKYCKYYLVT